MQPPRHNPIISRAFVNLALVTTLLTAGLIVFGAVVRVTDSGLGCGTDWPLCDGRLIPPLDNLTAWIEWSHRLFAVLIGLLGLGMLVMAWRYFRRRNRLVLGATVTGAVLFAIQSLLGRFVVVYDLPPTMVTLHLGMAMLLLAALLLAAIAAWYRPQQTYEQDHVTLLAYITTALSLVIIFTGALVRGSGATLACMDWPLCNGQLFPFQQGQLQTLHMIHRYAVLGLGITLGLLVWYIYQMRAGRLLRGLALSALAVYLAQALVGALFVWTSATSVWGATHVGLASVTWALLVAISAIDTLNSREIAGKQDRTSWNPQSGTATR
jgi:heme A synthase